MGWCILKTIFLLLFKFHIDGIKVEFSLLEDAGILEYNIRIDFQQLPDTEELYDFDDGAIYNERYNTSGIFLNK